MVVLDFFATPLTPRTCVVSRIFCVFFWTHGCPRLFGPYLNWLSFIPSQNALVRICALFRGLWWTQHGRTFGRRGAAGSVGAREAARAHEPHAIALKDGPRGAPRVDVLSHLPPPPPGSYRLTTSWGPTTPPPPGGITSLTSKSRNGNPLGTHRLSVGKGITDIISLHRSGTYPW